MMRENFLCIHKNVITYSHFLFKFLNIEENDVIFLQNDEILS